MGTLATSRRLLLAVMCVGYFLVLLDVTVVNVALPSIGAALHAPVSSLQWVVDGYAVALAALLLAGGTVGDVRGHRPVVLTGLGLFGLASLGCAAAPSVEVLVVARAGQGVGAALLLPGTLAVISRAFPDPAEKARAIGAWAAVGSIALPAGPLVGGSLVEAAGWRAVFWLNVPIVLAGAAVAAALVRPDQPEGGRHLDVAGTVTAAVLLAGLTFGVIELGRSSTHTAIAGLVLAAAAAAALVVVERRATDPILPPGLLRRPDFVTPNLVAAAMNAGTLGLLFLLTLFLQDVQGRGALVAGLVTLPLFAPLTMIAPLAGRMTSRTGPRPVMLGGLLVAAAGVALVPTWHLQSAWWLLLPALLTWGIGLALLTPAVVAAAVAAVPDERAGLAAGVNNTARQAGGAIGIAAYGAAAGNPGQAAAYLRALHAGGIATAVLFVLAAVATARWVRHD